MARLLEPRIIVPFYRCCAGATNPHLECRQEVYLKNSLGWELVRGDVTGLNWNGIIRSPCPVSSLNEALFLVIRDRVLKRTIVVRPRDRPWFHDRCALPRCAKQRAYTV